MSGDAEKNLIEQFVSDDALDGFIPQLAEAVTSEINVELPELTIKSNTGPITYSWGLTRMTGG